MGHDELSHKMNFNFTLIGNLVNQPPTNEKGEEQLKDLCTQILNLSNRIKGEKSRFNEYELPDDFSATREKGEREQ